MRIKARVVTATEGLDPLHQADGEYRGHPDPHLWMDPLLADAYVRNIEAALGERYPSHATEFAERARRYLERLEALHREIAGALAGIEQERRKLVTPGATAYLLSNRLSSMMAIAASVGLLASVAGLYGSYYLDIASGPAMVSVVSAFFGAAFLFAPQQGVLARARARCRQQRASLDEDVLRAVVILDWEFGSEADVRLLCERLAAPARTVRGAVRRLRAKGLLERGSGPLRSTREGVDTAAPLVRRHRVIESYLYQVEGYGMADLHAAAESLEHDIDHETLDDMQRRLDDTVFDPHGHRFVAGGERSVELALTGRRVAEMEIDPLVETDRLAMERAHA